MRRFPIHTTESAPEQSRPIMQMSEQAMGYHSSLLGIMAESPTLTNGFAQLNQLFMQCSLSPLEREVVIMTVGRENNCEYCIAFHTFLCGMLKIPEGVVKSLRAGTPLSDQRLQVLAEFTRAVVRDKGYISDELWSRFTQQGFTQANALDVVVAASLQVLTNYTNHMGSAVLEPALKEYAWTRAEHAVSEARAS
jgi:alkylhydroperoxidase family enzyme